MNDKRAKKKMYFEGTRNYVVTKKLNKKINKIKKTEYAQNEKVFILIRQDNI